MMTPVVSVCITTYNHERFLAQALDSVLAQVRDFPIEILVGEDASTDDTRAIVETYAQRHPDIIRPFYHRAEDKLRIDGRLTGRRNFANNLLQARGDFLILLDGDDYWTDVHKLTRQVRFLQENPQYAGCFHNAIHVDDEGTMLDRLAVTLTQQDFHLRDILRTNPVPTMSCLFRNPHFTALPDWFYKTDMGDWPVHILTAQRGPLHYLPVVMAAYRIHDAGIWQPFREDRSRAFLSQIRVWQILLAEAELGEEDYLRALIEKNYQRIIRKQKDLGRWDEVARFVRERREWLGKIDAYTIRQQSRLLWTRIRLK